MPRRPTLTDLLADIAPFSRHIIGLPLYDYQLQPLHAILASLRGRHGRQFLLIFPRQSGKNEAIAQLLVYLLNILQRRGGSIVYGATGDGLGRGLRRLDKRLDNPLNAGCWRKTANPLTRWLGRASIVFLSTHPQAATRGETAHHLLVVDELQDQDHSHLEAVFEPLRAANNATAIYIGTVRTTADALWLKKQQLEQRQAQDGHQRLFIVQPDAITAQNPNYAAFLAAKTRQYGRQHPIIASEYYNEPIAGGGGLFDKRRQQLMRGRHPRQTAPDPAHTYVATLDVAGQDEAATDVLAALDNPGRDYTVAHIFQLDLDHEEIGTIYRAVDIFVDHGSRHFEHIPGRPSLAARLLAWLQHWRVAHLIADDTGVGAGLVSWFKNKLGPDHVTGYTFSPPNKARLGSLFISCIETGRFKYWTDDEDHRQVDASQLQADSCQPQTDSCQSLSDSWWFWQQVAHCGYHVPAGGQFDRHLQWSVPSTAKVSIPQGLANAPALARTDATASVNDDRLISASLVSLYDDLIATGQLRLGRAASAIVPAADPLNDLSW